ncbi:MAG TPA: CoA-binding protein, partial [Bacillota bacterium]|nr:CoA-binding protein [Bacillota bacterium]
MASEIFHNPDLHSFFNPRSIAVVGASADPIKPGGKIIELLRHCKFPGQIFPVNPGRKEIQGLACYGNLAEIKLPVDLVVIALAAKEVPAAVRSCAALGLHNIVVISAGFAELGAEGAALQAELKELVQRYGLNLLGPNCIGFVNALLPAAASFSLAVDSDELRRGPAAFVAQSGGLGVLALYLADLEHLGVSYMINTGNEAGLDFSSIISFLVREPAVKVIGGYLEGVVNGDRLRRSFREAAEAGKPVVLLKAGDSREAVEAISSHTGALAGSREAYQAVFRQEGVLPVSTMTEMISLLKAFASGRLPAGNRVGVFALSGGMGVLTADLCSAAGLQLARFEDKTEVELRR